MLDGHTWHSSFTFHYGDDFIPLEVAVSVFVDRFEDRLSSLQEYTLLSFVSHCLVRLSLWLELSATVLVNWGQTSYSGFFFQKLNHGKKREFTSTPFSMV